MKLRGRLKSAGGLLLSSILVVSCSFLGADGAGSKSGVRDRLPNWLTAEAFSAFHSAGKGGCTFAEFEYTIAEAVYSNVLSSSEQAMQNWVRKAGNEAALFAGLDFLIFENVSFMGVIDRINELGADNLSDNLGEHVFNTKTCHAHLARRGYERNDVFQDLLSRPAKAVLIGRRFPHTSVIVLDDQTAFYVGP